MDKRTVFISYSQKDWERVSLFASLMAKNGFDIWMDVKRISLGESIISAVASALNQADVYMLFISNNSNKSSWVSEELNIALTKSIENKKPRIIPVLLDDCNIPITLTGRLYLDARKSIQDALKQLCNNLLEIGMTTPMQIIAADKPILTEIRFVISKDSDISVGPFCTEFTKEDLIDSRGPLLRLLRKTANGILMNFVPLSDFDLQSPIPKYKNGLYDEYIEQISGSTITSISEKAVATVTVFNPDTKKLYNLINTELGKLYITSLSYVFSLPFQKADFDKECMQRIQDNYSILSYDYEDGATIEYNDGFFVSVKCTSEQIQIKLQTEYDFSFSREAVSFSPTDFIDWLLGRR